MTRMDQLNGVIWLDGKMTNWQDAKVHVLTHTLHYGLGVFEGVRVYPTEHGSAIFRLADHTRRLFNSAHILQMKIPYSPDEISAAHIESVRSNKVKHGYIRPMCFYGSEEMGLRARHLKTHAMVAAWEWPSYMSPDGLKNGIKVRTSSYTRHHINISMCKAKCNGHYVNSILALQEAVSCGCEEALLLDNEGYVAEGTGENVFLVRDGVLHTPSLTSCLDGITRRTVMRLAADMGVDYVERQITRDEFYVAEEAFFCGTAAEVVPIRCLDDRTIGNGKPGPLTKKLQDAYFNCVTGKSPEYDNFLTYVSGT